MVYSTMLDGIIYGAVWYNICHPKVFGVPSQSLWGTFPKSLGALAKVFGGISERLSHTNVYTTKRERLYHRKLWFIS